MLRFDTYGVVMSLRIRKKPLLIVAGLLAAGLTLIWTYFDTRREAMNVSVLAASGSDQMSQYLQSSNGGMAQYGLGIEGSASATQTVQVLSNWNSYVSSRSQWSLSSALITRLANADRTARQIGSASITPQQLADAATRLINSKLDSMTLAQQQDLYRQMSRELTPKSSLGLASGSRHVTAFQKPDGKWNVAVSPDAFSKRKTYFKTSAPGMVSPSANFYPAEAILVFYSVASGDMGFDNTYVAKVKKSLADLTGLDMTGRALFGESGYLARRPMTTFLTEPAISAFFTDLHF